MLYNAHCLIYDVCFEWRRVVIVWLIGVGHFGMCRRTTCFNVTLKICRLSNSALVWTGVVILASASTPLVDLLLTNLLLRLLRFRSKMPDDPHISTRAQILDFSLA